MFLEGPSCCFSLYAQGRNPGPVTNKNDVGRSMVSLAECVMSLCKCGAISQGSTSNCPTDIVKSFSGSSLSFWINVFNFHCYFMYIIFFFKVLVSKTVGCFTHVKCFHYPYASTTICSVINISQVASRHVGQCQSVTTAFFRCSQSRVKATEKKREMKEKWEYGDADKHPESVKQDLWCRRADIYTVIVNGVRQLRQSSSLSRGEGQIYS